MKNDKIKTFGEVFTPPELVNEILDQLPEEVWQKGKTFCDPSAGNGNFLVEVYKRKVEKHHHDPIAALKTIYGIEIQLDNTMELRKRLTDMAKQYLGEKYEKSRIKIKKILDNNIRCADALTFDFEKEFGDV